LNEEIILENMEKNLKVLEIESCLLIYFYLLVYGKNTPIQIRSDLKISKATFFRSLGFLLDADFVRKDENVTGTDKRYGHIYLPSKGYQEIFEFPITSELQEIAKQKGKSQILTKWENIIKTSPLIFSSILSKIFSLKKHTEPQIKTITVNDNSEKSLHIRDQDDKRGRRIQVFSLIEASKDDDLFPKIQEFLESLTLSQASPEKGEKMKKPISFMIDIIEL